MAARRKMGDGSVSAHRGRWRVRVRTADGKRQSLGVYDTKQEAEGVLEGALVALDEKHMLSPGGVTLRAFGEEWLNRRELGGYRSASNDRGIFRRYVCIAPFADWPIANVRRRDIAAWLDDLVMRKNTRKSRAFLAYNTIDASRRVLRSCLAAAVDRGLIQENPALNVKIPMKRSEGSWQYLSLEGQDLLLSNVPIPYRWMVGFAMWTGVRLGELQSLELSDVDTESSAPHIMVRYGSPIRKPTKTGKTRKVPLFGYGLECAREWIAALPQYLRGKNVHGLMFPRLSGAAPPKRARPPSGWDRWRADAGLTTLRWHDLRHTCASSLVCGWWGHKWTLGEVQMLLGHSSTKMTKKYAHLADSVLDSVAQRTGTQLGHRQHDEEEENLMNTDVYDANQGGQKSYGPNLRGDEQSQSLTANRDPAGSPPDDLVSYGIALRLAAAMEAALVKEGTTALRHLTIAANDWDATDWEVAA